LAQAALVKAPTHAELIETLKKAHSLLVNADHDYDGHRAKAAEEVRKALEDLGDRPKKARATVAPTIGGVVAAVPVRAAQPKMHEPQAASDAQLREAEALLEGALAHLNGKHPNAHKNVRAAIAEIKVALAIK
jgi:hypothetical protein